jgi:acyl-CoA synthetase (AMP-forming)/AMP-acid ligase II
MTARVFHAIGAHARDFGDRPALRSGNRIIDYRSLTAFLAASAKSLTGAPPVVGITDADPLEAALADLALTFTGRTSIHLPPFFSIEQKAHIIAAAGITAIIGPFGDHGQAIALQRPESCDPVADLPAPAGSAKRIIFTSGSSGRPKGVVIGERQMAAAIAGLERTILPVPSDLHLSLLPMAQLLEQIAGLYLPLLAGAQVRFCPEALPALFGGPVEPLVQTLFEAKPTTTILVPALLSRLLTGLGMVGLRAPESLRFVAVGGAATAPALLDAALAQGMPVYEGYGLSECSSVVALNRPGASRPGSVGRVLDGLQVRIDDGEIVVSGPTVMEGYLGQPAIEGEWRTGDLGRFENGDLIVEGRKDWLIVTPEGRNINPEWIEANVTADIRIPAAGVRLAQDGRLEIIAVVASAVTPQHVAELLGGLPPYARPARVIFVPASLPGLLKPGGGMDRSRLGALAASHPSIPLKYEFEELTA